MLLTGTSSILSGAPGAVMLYPLLGLAIYPRKPSKVSFNEARTVTGDGGLLSRRVLRWVLAGFWFFAALLQLQPNWWQPGQISQAIGAMVGQGGLNTVLVDPVLTQLSKATVDLEIPLNIALIVVFLAIGIGLAFPGEKHLRPFLIVSIVASVIIWYLTEAFGMILTGMATDFNSGLLVVVMALAVWPHVWPTQNASVRSARLVCEASQEEGSNSAQLPSIRRAGQPSLASLILLAVALHDVGANKRRSYMRVRPFFWVLLGCVCGGVLVFAMVMPTRTSAVMQVAPNQCPAPNEFVTIQARVTDTQVAADPGCPPIPAGVDDQGDHGQRGASAPRYQLCVSDGH